MNDDKLDFIRILQEIRGTSAQGEAYTDGMWWELTIKVIDYMDGAGSYSGGIYTHIKYMYENTKTDLGEFYVSYEDFLIKYADFLVTYEEMLLLKEDIDDALEDANNIGKDATSEYWKAVAEKMTASSYAIEPEDVFVKIYTSNGDGTFYSEDTAEYSALHWAAKAEDISSSEAFYKLDGSTPLTGHIPANGNKVTDLGDGVDDQDAVTVKQLADLADDISNSEVFYKLDGSIPLTGHMPANGNKVTDLGDGIDDQDAVTVKQLSDLVPSIATIALLSTVDTDVTTTIIVTETGRGGTFNYDASQSGTNNGGTIFDGWVRQYSGAISVKWFGALSIVDNPTVDNSDAIQASIDYAFSIAGRVNTVSVAVVVITGNNDSYAMSKPLLINQNKQKFTIRDLGLAAIDEGYWLSSVLSGEHDNTFNNALIQQSSSTDTTYDNLLLEGRGLANGIQIFGGGSPNIINCTIYHYPAFGVQMYAGAQLRLRTSKISQWRGDDIEYKDQSKMTAYGLWSIHKGDMEILDCQVFKNKYNLFIEGGANFRVFGNHFFNGSSDSLIQWVKPINIMFIEGANSFNVSFIGNYIDNGEFHIIGSATNSCLITDNEFYNNGTRALIDTFVRCRPTQVDQEIRPFTFTASNTFQRDGNATVRALDMSDDSGFNYDISDHAKNINSQHAIDTMYENGGAKLIQLKKGGIVVQELISNGPASLIEYTGTTTTNPVRAGANGNQFEITGANKILLSVGGDGIVTVQETALKPEIHDSMYLGTEENRWKNAYLDSILMLSPKATEPLDGLLGGQAIAISDGTASTRNFGVDGIGPYFFNGFTWIRMISSNQ